MTLLTQPPNSCTGFPLKITKTGSYRLVSNLTVSCPNKDAIDVTPTVGPPLKLVTIDLNGFSIIGPGSGIGIGIFASADASLVVHNGGVAAMGAGIDVFDCKVEEVHVLFNVGGGIFCRTHGVILNNTVLDNGGPGISVFDGVVQGNKAGGNQFEGIFAFVGLVQNNMVNFNGFTSFIPNGAAGIDVANATVTENNVFVNGGDGIDVEGGGSKVGENSVAGNSGDGIDVESHVTGVNVIGNTAADNGGFGIRFFDATSAFTSNVVNGNSNGGASCDETTTCNGQVCKGLSPFGATSNDCDGVQG